MIASVALVADLPFRLFPSTEAEAKWECVVELAKRTAVLWDVARQFTGKRRKVPQQASMLDHTERGVEEFGSHGDVVDGRLLGDIVRQVQAFCADGGYEGWVATFPVMLTVSERGRSWQRASWNLISLHHAGAARCCCFPERRPKSMSWARV